jgi:hypothetical protein
MTGTPADRHTAAVSRAAVLSAATWGNKERCCSFWLPDLENYRNLACDRCERRSDGCDRPRCCNTCRSNLPAMFRFPLVQTHCWISKIG